MIFVWDTCRADFTSTCGSVAGRTPTLDAVATGGVRWTTAVAPSPWTAPSHGSLFTGVLPEEHGLMSTKNARLRPDIPVLSEQLGAAGWETVLIAANPFLAPHSGLARGFEHVDAAYEGVPEKARGSHVHARVRDWLADREARGETRPFFLVVNLMDAHLPYRPDRDTVDPLDGGRADAAIDYGYALSPGAALAAFLGLSRFSPEQMAGIRAVYAAGVRDADRFTGLILEDLEALGRGPAFVAITADHGEALGEHGEIEHQMTMREVVLRIPLVVRWPDRRNARRHEDGLVRLQDLNPTVLEVAGLPTADRGRGGARSLSLPPEPETFSFGQYNAPLALLPAARQALPDAPPEAFAPFRRDIRTLHEQTTDGHLWKLILWSEPGPRGLPRVVQRALFELRSDPGEERDRLTDPEDAEAHARLARMAAMIH